MVLGVHLTYLWRFSHVFSHLNAITQQGSVGVSLFFILSGFVLTYSYRPGDRPRNFWRRRVARIVPGYVVAVLLSLPVSAFEHRSGYVLPTVFNLTLLQAWIPKATWFSGGNQVGWSLSAEAFFYLTFPFIIDRILGLRRRERLGLLAAMIGYAIAIPLLAHPSGHEIARQLGWRYWLIYISPVVRIAEFVVGIVLCTIFWDPWTKRIPLWMAALLSAGVYLLDVHVPRELSYAAVTLIPFSLLILACAQHDQRESGGRFALLSSKGMVALGRWSYAFFLVHQLVIRVFARLIVVEHLSTNQKAVGVVALVPVAWLLAWLLYRFIEIPLEKRLRSPVATARVEDELSAEADFVDDFDTPSVAL